LLSLAPAVLVAMTPMTGVDSRLNGREKAVKEEPKASRGSGESHQKLHQKLHYSTVQKSGEWPHRVCHGGGALELRGAS
jgi:hypothetical protein